MDEEAIRILKGKSFAHIALVDEQGRPHVSPVWIDVDEQGRPVLNTAEGRTKARLLQLGAPVALSACAEDDPYHYVLVRGRVAERTHEGANAVIDSLAQKYRGRDFGHYEPERVTIIIEPEFVSIPQ